MFTSSATTPAHTCCFLRADDALLADKDMRAQLGHSAKDMSCRDQTATKAGDISKYSRSHLPPLFLAFVLDVIASQTIPDSVQPSNFATS